jgi:hypothetical protein
MKVLKKSSSLRRSQILNAKILKFQLLSRDLTAKEKNNWRSSTLLRDQNAKEKMN